MHICSKQDSNRELLVDIVHLQDQKYDPIIKKATTKDLKLNPDFWVIPESIVMNEDDISNKIERSVAKKLRLRLKDYPSDDRLRIIDLNYVDTFPSIKNRYWIRAYFKSDQLMLDNQGKIHYVGIRCDDDCNIVEFVDFGYLHTIKDVRNGYTGLVNEREYCKLYKAQENGKVVIKH